MRVCIFLECVLRGLGFEVGEGTEFLCVYVYVCDRAFIVCVCVCLKIKAAEHSRISPSSEEVEEEWREKQPCCTWDVVNNNNRRSCNREDLHASSSSSGQGIHAEVMSSYTRDDMTSHQGQRDCMPGEYPTHHVRWEPLVHLKGVRIICSSEHELPLQRSKQG